ncbi:RT0821/Lpp0805 family surface protein [Aestuariirhabdus sp. LZHN29]|uniref:RT0821/Lpp0805 family surface protein n=1 Tax=Aestuariirhabdus sp. LZHN29 TaxID=3417462 RepID=UPI003CF3C685
MRIESPNKRPLSTLIPGALLLLVLGGCAATKQPPLFKSMTGEDVSLANKTLDASLESMASGKGMTWLNSVNGHSGSVTPTGTYRRADGVYCRDYRETLTIDTRFQQWRDTACRANDGRWIPVR